jgi:hypothetical protein
MPLDRIMVRKPRETGFWEAPGCELHRQFDPRVRLILIAGLFATVGNFVAVKASKKSAVQKTL